MKLTGKSKEDFNKWYVTEYRKNIDKGCVVYPISAFNFYHLSMQFGVYVDFFDSVCIKIIVQNVDFQNYFFFEIKLPESSEYYKEVLLTKSRAETRQKAIQKACDIYNNQFITTEAQ